MSRLSKLFLPLLLIAALLIAACGGAAAPAAPAAPAADEAAAPAEGAAPADAAAAPAGECTDVQLTYWNPFTGPDGAFMKQMVDKFNEEQAGKITVAVQTQPQYYDKVSAALTSDSLPDVMIVHLDQLATWAARGALQPLDNVIANLGITDADYPAAVWQGFDYKGSRYGLPLDIHPLTFYVNKTLLAEAGIDKIPTNKEEFEAAATAMTKGNVKGYVEPVLWPGFLIGQALLFQNGGRLVDETGEKAAFNSEAGKIAMQQLLDWNKAGFSLPEVAIDAQSNAFKAGTNAMTMDGIWMIQGFRDAGVDFEAAPIPQFGPEYATWAGSHQLTIPAHKKGEDPCKVAAAGELIGYLTANAAVWAEGGQIPARLSARNSEEFKAVMPQANVAPSVDSAVFMPPVPGITDAGAQWETAVNQVLSGEKTIEQALADAENNANKLLEENRAKYAAGQ